MGHVLSLLGPWLVAIALVAVVGLWWLSGWRNIKSNEQGLVERIWGGKDLPQGQFIARKNERGFQARQLMPGWQWIANVINKVHEMPVVQIGSDEMGLVVAQVGAPLPVGARTAIYKPEFGDFEDVNAFLENGGQKGNQRWVLRPGTYRIHPVAFLVITRSKVYGIPMDPELKKKGQLTAADFNLDPDDLRPTIIRSQKDTPSGDDESQTTKGGVIARRRERLVNQMGVLTSKEGSALEEGQLACRLGGYTDIEQETDPKKRINIILNNRNSEHHAYQDFETFLARGGRTGLQHDPVTEGTYYFNPWLLSVETLPVLHVFEGEVAVIKSKVGLVEQDISGKDFKFGSIVLPGHRGLWSEPIRTGSWLLNPRCYEATIVPTRILTLYWADNTNAAGKLDQELKTIQAKSRDGFEFRIELQVQIHISDVNAPRVISMMGTVENLINTVLQSAVGNYFRNKIQSMQATDFIQQRDQVQEAAFNYIREKLEMYEIVTLGVFLQDITLPTELTDVLKQREIAGQKIPTYEQSKLAEEKRLETEAAKGRADQQAELARSEVGIMVAENTAKSQMKKADGDAYSTQKAGEGQAAAIRAVGTAEAAASEAKGLALAAGLQAQKDAVGEGATTLVNIIKAISDGKVQITPQVQVNGGGGGAADGVMALVMKQLSDSLTVPTAPAKTDTPDQS